jgi:hypothetical protein
MSGRPRERPDISMPAAEIEQFLSQRATVIVVANDPASPAPVATVARAEYTDRVVEVDLPSDDPVAKALTDGSPICCVAEQFPSYYEIKAVIIRGVAEARSAAGATQARFGVALGSPTSFDFGRLPDAPGSIPIARTDG